MGYSTLNESETRYTLIDPQLKKAGWNLADRTCVGFEIPVQGYDASPASGITDYCLYRSNGEVLAVIEAKRTRRDAKAGKEQVLQYITEIAKKQSFRPFAFMTNGDEVFFWDSEEAAERQIATFFTCENLERLLFLKQNRLPLSSIQIKESIVNRPYQVEAIRRIGEALEKRKKRKALLVMATGTGKTRTTMALIDVFLRARQAQRVLFLADRDSLVDQALTDGFKVHLPSESRERIRTFLLDDPKESMKIKGARVLVSTLQTLELCYDKFSPADFDLIISDECHRSIYNKFTDVLAYFDAVQIGLTATPAHFIDRDTFRFFECDGPAPTFLYTYDQAVKEGYLADYNVYSAQTKFQRAGIKGIELSEVEQDALREKGIDPADINFEGTDIEKKVTNRDTLAKQWEEFIEMCHTDASGQLPAKTIVFAITHKHAMRLEQVFNEMYPEHKGLLARVIDSQVERAKDLIDQFKKQDFPRIAISVDMLDTGLDVPEVMNLAFMKPVGSQIKFWQMIGRGTRSLEACRKLDWLPDRQKDNFLIVDFWENFEHFNMMPKDDQGPRQIPVLVTIFNTRLTKLEILMSSPLTPLQSGEGENQPTVFTQLPKRLLENARELRKNQTDAEEFLWQLLRNRQLNGLKFRRQHPLPKGIILDFYCAETKLAVELDGAVHLDKEQKEYDEGRTYELKDYGIRVIRFWNDEVLKDTERVLEEILKASSPEKFLTPDPSPIGEGDSQAHPFSTMEKGPGDEDTPPSPFWRRAGDEERIISSLRSLISRIPLDSFTVKKQLKEVREAWDDDFWKHITDKKIEFLRLKVAPLLRFVPDVNLPEALFTSKVERCGLFLLQKKDVSTLRETIREDVSLLPTNLSQVAPHLPLINEVLSATWWERASLKQLDDARDALAPLMKYRKQMPSEPLELDLQDLIDSRKWVIVRKEGLKMMVDEYRKKVEEKIEQLAHRHPTIQRLKQGEDVAVDDLMALEQTLETELGTDELNLTDDNMLKAFGVRVCSLVDFLMHVLKLEALPTYEQIVRKAFDAFILEHNYNADQTRFLRTVQSVFLHKRRLETADLYEPPFSNFGVNAVEKLFSENEVEELMVLTKKLAA